MTGVPQESLKIQEQTPQAHQFTSPINPRADESLAADRKANGIVKGHIVHHMMRVPSIHGEFFGTVLRHESSTEKQRTPNPALLCVRARSPVRVCSSLNASPLTLTPLSLIHSVARGGARGPERRNTSRSGWDYDTRHFPGHTTYIIDHRSSIIVGSYRRSQNSDACYRMRPPLEKLAVKKPSLKLMKYCT